jgi:hypothetical protein
MASGIDGVTHPDDEVAQINFGGEVVDKYNKVLDKTYLLLRNICEIRNNAFENLRLTLYQFQKNKYAHLGNETDSAISQANEEIDNLVKAINGISIDSTDNLPELKKKLSSKHELITKFFLDNFSINFDRPNLNFESVNDYLSFAEESISELDVDDLTTEGMIDSKKVEDVAKKILSSSYSLLKACEICC